MHCSGPNNTEILPPNKSDKHISYRYIPSHRGDTQQLLFINHTVKLIMPTTRKTVRLPQRSHVEDGKNHLNSDEDTNNISHGGRPVTLKETDSDNAQRAVTSQSRDEKQNSSSIVRPSVELPDMPRLLPSEGYYTLNKGRRVEFHDWIADYVQPATRVALRKKMQEQPSGTDKAGYIYAFAIGGRNPDERLEIKIGREMRVDERFKKWSKHYNGYGARHLFPEKSQKVPAYKKVERLIHLEIGDLVQHKAYLDPGFIRSGRRPAPRAKGSKEPCVVAGCDTNHLEIFSFDPDTNRRYLDKIVTSIIMKWSKFSIEFD
jgi:hypothetical protein